MSGIVQQFLQVTRALGKCRANFSSFVDIGELLHLLTHENFEPDPEYTVAANVQKLAHTARRVPAA